MKTTALVLAFILPLGNATGLCCCVWGAVLADAPSNGTSAGCGCCRHGSSSDGPSVAVPDASAGCACIEEAQEPPADPIRVTEPPVVAAAASFAVSDPFREPCDSPRARPGVGPAPPEGNVPLHLFLSVLRV